MSFRVEIEHAGLKKHRLVTGRDRAIVERKRAIQLREWEDQWERQQLKERAAQDKHDRIAEAAEATRQAQQAFHNLSTILTQGLASTPQVNWEHLKARDAYAELPPVKPDTTAMEAKITFWDKILGDAKYKRDAAIHNILTALHQWEKDKTSWRSRCDDHVQRQNEANDAIDILKSRYFSLEPDAINEYCDLILSQSRYPIEVPKEFQASYDPASRIVVVDYQLPSLDDIPTLKEVKFAASRNQLVSKHRSEREIQLAFDGVCYQICLRTIHELFREDAALAIDSMVFNGFVHFIDRRTGTDTRSCIISLHAVKDAFSQIKLDRVDPRDCFRSMKGVGSSQLYGMVAVAPILQLRRDDPRFIPGREIIETLNDETNLAAIGWEQFEHLIREVFQSEFSRDGGEVKVTQSSRDGGVDAIAFDADPIRGGKIVIQAKRYTNTVGVSSVRDLYGTVMNEGATKGILVTTSSFGHDAYKFAAEKPISLIDGSGLLHLLQRHGRKARIDLAEAKQLGVGLQR